MNKLLVIWRMMNTLRQFMVSLFFLPFSVYSSSVALGATEISTHVGLRHTGVIPTDTPLNFEGLNPVFHR